MAKRQDWDIMWILLMAGVCWFALWRHDLVSTWVKKAWDLL